MIFMDIFLGITIILLIIVPIHLGMILAYKRRKEESLLNKIKTIGDLIYVLFFAWIITPFFVVYTKDPPESGYYIILEFVNILIQKFGISGAYAAILLIFVELFRLRRSFDKDLNRIDKDLDQIRDLIKIEIEKSEKHLSTRIDDLKRDIQSIMDYLLKSKKN